MELQNIRRLLKQIIEFDPAACRSLAGIFVLEIPGKEESLRVALDFRNEPVIQDLADDAAVPRAAVSISLSQNDAVAIIAGDLTAQQAFLEGRLKAAGDLQTLLRFNIVFELLQKAAVSVRPNGASLT